MGWLPFRSPCPKCGAEPSPMGLASLAVLHGETVSAFIAEEGTLCAAHCAEIAEEFSLEENMHAYVAAVRLVEDELVRRRAALPSAQTAHSAWLYLLVGGLLLGGLLHEMLQHLVRLLSPAQTGTLYEVLVAVANTASVLFPIWLFTGVATRVERFCAPYCSGCVNVSIIYVPLLAVVMALAAKSGVWKDTGTAEDS